MQELADMELLKQYVNRNSDEAFAALVTRHVNMIYSVALRKTTNPNEAEEITQAVFIILARKAPRLSDKTILAGWLYQTARLTAVNFQRKETRRTGREHEAYMQSLSNDGESEVWSQIAPLLEDAMGRLGEKDRNAIVLRFIEEKSFQEIGAAFGASENAAKKRVGHALEKLRGYFSKRGVTTTTAIIAGVISANSVQAAPIGLATAVTIAAVKGTSVTTSTLTLIKTTLKIMTWTKLKTTVVVGAIAIMAVGTAVVTTRQEKSPANSSSPSFAGYATPEATLQSSLWAGNRGDFNKFLDGCAPEQVARFKNKMAGKSDDEIRRETITWARAMAGYKVTQNEVIADDEVHLHISAPPSAEGLHSGKVIVIMKKFGVEWKQVGDL